MLLCSTWRGAKQRKEMTDDFSERRQGDRETSTLRKQSIGISTLGRKLSSMIQQNLTIKGVPLKITDEMCALGPPIGNSAF